MTRSTGSTVRTASPSLPLRTEPQAPVDVAVTIRGVVYPLPVSLYGMECGYEAVVATGAQALMAVNHQQRGRGWVVATLQPVHARDCHEVQARWDRKQKKKIKGDCDCGAVAALRALVARGRV